MIDEKELNKLKEECKQQEDCSNCKYNSLCKELRTAIINCIKSLEVKNGKQSNKMERQRPFSFFS